MTSVQIIHSNFNVPAHQVFVGTPKAAWKFLIKQAEIAWQTNGAGLPGLNEAGREAHRQLHNGMITGAPGDEIDLSPYVGVYRVEAV